MTDTLEIPRVEQILDQDYERKIGHIVNAAVGESYATYKERLKQNTTNEHGTLMPEAVVMNAAGIQLGSDGEDDKTVYRDQEGNSLETDLDALQTAFSKIRTDFNIHRDLFAAHDIDIEPIATEAMQMGDGTERGLEHYYADQYQLYSGDGHENFADMLRGWTAQEKTHSPILQMVARAAGIYDERKMTHIQNRLITGGIEVKTISFPAIGAFTQPQEHLTYASHTNNALLLGKSGQAGVRPVAGQEILHENLFGRNNEHYLALDQELTDYTMRMFASVWAYFNMPASHSYPNYGRVSLQLSNTGLFTHEMVVDSFKRSADSLGLLSTEVVGDEAKMAKEFIREIVNIDSPTNQSIIARMAEKREKYVQKIKKKGQIPFVLGRTVTFEKGEPVFHTDAA